MSFATISQAREILLDGRVYSVFEPDRTIQYYVVEDRIVSSFPCVEGGIPTYYRLIKDHAVYHRAGQKACVIFLEEEGMLFSEFEETVLKKNRFEKEVVEVKFCLKKSATKALQKALKKRGKR